MNANRQPAPATYVRNEDWFSITYIYVVFGSITLLLNTPLAVYLLKTTNKNQKELIVIIALSLSDNACAGQFLAMGIYRFVVWYNEVYFVTQASCNLNLIVASYQICIQMDNCYTLIIALDRLFAVLFPVNYIRVGLGYTMFLVTAPVFASFLGYGVHLLFVSLSTPQKMMDEICFNFSSALPGFRIFLGYQRMLCVFIPTCIYFFIFIRMKLRFQKYGNSSGMNKGMKHLTRTVAYITIASFFLVLIPEVWWYFGLFGGMDASFYFMFILLKKIVTFFIHTLRHRELMKHVEKYLPKKLTNIIHMDATSHSALSKVKPQKEHNHQVSMR